jgi:protein TonB
MWDETLIESMGKRNNGKRWLTVQVAAIVHAGVVAVLAAASFWYSDAMTLPAQSQPITGVFFAESLPTPPVAFGVRHHTTEANTASNNSKPVLQEVTQENIVPENGNVVQSSTPFTDVDNFGDLPEGDENGVPGGVRDGKGDGGFDGKGISGNGPIAENDFRFLGVEQPVLIHRVEPIYPKAALAAKIQGTVVLKALISARGDVQNIVIISAAHPLLNKSAIEAVGNWKYRPATVKGKPVAVYFQVTVVFKIR